MDNPKICPWCLAELFIDFERLLQRDKSKPLDISELHEVKIISGESGSCSKCARSLEI